MQQQFRLRKNAQFRYVFRKGRGMGCREMSLTYVRAGRIQVGFSVSKKVGNSVKRHRVTRLLRETVRKYDASVAVGCRIIIIARPTVAEVGLDEVSEAVKNLFKAHRIWKDSEK